MFNLASSTETRLGADAMGLSYAPKYQSNACIFRRCAYCLRDAEIQPRFNNELGHVNCEGAESSLSSSWLYLVPHDH